jgi:hypothetical protein
MHRLHTTMPTAELNGALAEGAYVVWIDPHGTDMWDVVLDHPELDPGVDAVLAFLQSVNPGALDEAMAKAHRLSESPGTVALRTLIALAGSDERT